MSRTQPSSAKRRLLWITGVFAVVAALAFLLGRNRENPRSLSSAPSNQVTVATPLSTSAASAPQHAFQPLIGHWMREDGGYVLEIRAVEPDGKLQARYLNPRPINISRAVAVTEGRTVKVGVELRDVGYPGSTYTLLLDKELDQLVGTYFQAGMRQTFDVTFVRMRL